MRLDIHCISRAGQFGHEAIIAKWGNSIGVRFPKPLAQELGLIPGREVDLSKEGFAGHH